MTKIEKQKILDELARERQELYIKRSSLKWYQWITKINIDFKIKNIELKMLNVENIKTSK